MSPSGRVPGDAPLSDDELLEATARLWEQLDPPPVDLADGVLARVAAEDLEFDLLTLVEGEQLAGVRHVTDGVTEDLEESGSWSLEYTGPNLHAYLRVTRVEEHTRLDGWVVPARAMSVELRPESGLPHRVALDEFGRFAFTGVAPGAHRLGFLEEQSGSRLRLTPPFWI
jgi:hypothetical protein